MEEFGDFSVGGLSGYRRKSYVAESEDVADSDQGENSNFDRINRDVTGHVGTRKNTTPKVFGVKFFGVQAGNVEETKKG